MSTTRAARGGPRTPCLATVTDRAQQVVGVVLYVMATITYNLLDIGYIMIL